MHMNMTELPLINMKKKKKKKFTPQKVKLFEFMSKIHVQPLWELDKKGKKDRKKDDNPSITDRKKTFRKAIKILQK